jgi:hypothetical protein
MICGDSAHFVLKMGGIMATFRIPMPRWARCQPTISVTVSPAYRRRAEAIFGAILVLVAFGVAIGAFHFLVRLFR